MALRINGVGSCLVDNLYSPVDFSSSRFSGYCSKTSGDGGLVPGQLVFGEDLEKFSGCEYSSILKELTGGASPVSVNIGGPCIAALINLQCLLHGSDAQTAFYGYRGDDPNGKFLADRLQSSGLDLSNYQAQTGVTPFTDVLSDPDYLNGQGERTFVHYLGLAGSYSTQDISSNFFDADICVYGGTGILPVLHSQLSDVLKTGKKFGCLNFVNTVYDFRNQQENPDKPWPLVSDPDDFKEIDLLLMDNEEALRISGTSDNVKALLFFKDAGVRVCVITHGAKPIAAFSDGSLCHKVDSLEMPVLAAAGEWMKATDYHGDTTGCGDNFAGGVMASIALQMQRLEPGTLNLEDAISWGAASGGFACTYIGGVYAEQTPGEKLEKIREAHKLYRKQIGESFDIMACL